MKCLTAIPFEIDAAQMMARVHIEPDTAEAAEFGELIRKARAVGKPKAVYKECYIAARGADTVTLEGIMFTSRILRKNLDTVGRVFPFIATCGRELDEAAPPKGDLLLEYWWDAIKAALLVAAHQHLLEHLRESYFLARAASMNPGSGDAAVWPIEQQRLLFALMGDVTGAIGVELTDSFLMVPNKTISGIRFPTEKDFRSCQVCRRENCPNRAAPLDEVMWAALHGDEE
jgi:hypothetical protein